MPGVLVNSVKIHYEVDGTGDEAVLLIPGLGCDVSDWPVLADALAKKFTVVRMDCRGAGRSDSPPPPYTTEQMAADAAGLLDHLGIANAHVAGYSMGGIIALELALSHPGKVSALVLAATAAAMSQRNKQLFDTWVEAVENGMPSESLIREVCFWMYPPERFDETGFLDRIVAETMAYPYQQPLEGFRGQVDALNSYDAAGRLPQITAQTLVVAGGRDMLIDAKDTKQLADTIPNAQLAIIPDQGHRLHREVPEEFSGVICEFLM